MDLSVQYGECIRLEPGHGRKSVSNHQIYPEIDTIDLFYFTDLYDTPYHKIEYDI